MLTAGTTLTIPAGVVRTGNAAATFRPYDPSDAYGDTAPTTPRPQATPARRNRGCGVLGQILLVAVAVAVTIATKGATAKLIGAAFKLGAGISGVIGGAVAGAAASVASQGVGLITGIQDKFSWTGVALGALSGAVSGAIGPKGIFGASGAFGNIGSEALRAGVQGAVTSAVTQGVGVAVGLQSRFSFTGVAAAGIGAAAGGAIGRGVGAGDDFGGRLAVNTARGLANAATRSALDGTSFGDNLIAALPDVIGGTIGEYVSMSIASGSNTALRGPAGATARGAPTGTASSRADRYGSMAPEGSYAAQAGAGPSDPAQTLPTGRGSVVETESEIIITADPVSTFAIHHLSETDYLSVHSMAQIYDWSPGRESRAMVARYVQSLQRPSATLANPSFIATPSLTRLLSASPSNASISSYTPSLWNDARAEFLYATNAGFAQRDEAYGQFSKGSYVGGAVNYVGSLVSRTSGTVTAGYTLAVSALRWRGFQPEPIDRQDAVILEMATGGLSVIRGTAGALAAESAGVGGLGANRYPTNGDLVQSIATRADNWGIRNGLGSGPVAGTLKHGYAEEVLTRYQRMFGDRGLTAEARYVGGAPWQPGMPTTGSVRLDVVEGPLANPTHVWDYKFGQATLSPSRITQIQNGIPNGANVPILLVKP